MNDIIKTDLGNFSNLQEASSKSKSFVEEGMLWEGQLDGKAVLLLLDEKKEKVVSAAVATKANADLKSLHVKDDSLITEKSWYESHFTYDEDNDQGETAEQFAANYQNRIKINGMKEGIQIDDPKLIENANQYLMDKISLTNKLKEAEAYKQSMLKCLSDTNVSSETMKQYLNPHDIIAVKKLQNNGKEDEVSGVVKADMLAHKGR